MADSRSSKGTSQARAPQASGSFQTFEPSPEPDTRAQEAKEGSKKGAWTVAAVFVAAVLAGLTVFFASRLAGAPGVTEVLVVSLIAFVIAFVGMIPVRWGWGVVPGVTLAGFGYLVYSMFFAANSRFQTFPQDAFGYAMFFLAGAVVLGFVAQGLYSAIMRL